MSQQLLLRLPTVSPLWFEVRDGDPLALALFQRHYSYRPYADGRRERVGYRNRWQFVGPGQKLVLITAGANALFVWRKFIDKSGQRGLNCAVFRNESNTLASTLILEAERVARVRWPTERLYTYVNPAKLQRTRQPGRCFLKSGWQPCGHTKGGLLILEKLLCVLCVLCALISLLHSLPPCLISCHC